MNLVKCENEHFYDADKFLFCPHCSNQITEINGSDNISKNQGQISTEPPGSRNEEDMVAVMPGKTVGWLVCIEGIAAGESFTLREGSNYIGRAASMDIALLYEPTVSREKHAIIIYEPAGNSFLLLSPGHPGQTFCNGKSVTKEMLLSNRDIITLGDCSLLFVPLCDSSFCWPAPQKGQQEVLP